MTTDEEEAHELRCDELSRKAARNIYGELSGIKGTGHRGLTELEGAIYGWLMDHAVFDDRRVSNG